MSQPVPRQDPYNNGVTYNDKWETPENIKALELLQKKYFDKSLCGPSCPPSWAVEVMAMLDAIEEQVGFRYNESTNRGYYIQGNMLQWFVTDPWKNLFSSVRRNVFGSPTTYRARKHCKPNGKRTMTLGERAENIWEGATHSLRYGYKAVKIKYLNPRLNKIQKRKVDLTQIKEKYGELRLYYSAPAAYEEFIENEIRKCEIKLAMKGAYWPIEHYYNATTSHNIENEWHPDSVEVKRDVDGTVNLKKTTYRKVMKELGLNLDEIKAKVEASNVPEEV